MKDETLAAFRATMAVEERLRAACLATYPSLVKVANLANLAKHDGDDGYRVRPKASPRRWPPDQVLTCPGYPSPARHHTMYPRRANR